MKSYFHISDWSILSVHVRRVNEAVIDMWGDYVLWTKDVQEDAWCFMSLDTCVGVRVLRNLQIYGIY